MISPGGFLNRLRNSTFVSWSNGVSGSIAASATNSAIIAASGWAVVVSGAGTATWAQVTSGYNGAAQSLKVTGATNVTGVAIAQRIESYDSAQLAGNPVTFQMAVYNNTGSSITPTIATYYAGSPDVWTSPVTDLSATNLQPCANGAWTIVAYTFVPSANATAGYEVRIDFGNHFSSAANYVQVTAAELRVTKDISTGLNTYPPVPELPNIEAELIRNARYFQTSYLNGTAPGASTYVGLVGGSFYVNGYIASPQQVLFPVQMRTSPPTTISYWDALGAANRTSYVTAPGGSTYTNGGVYGGGQAIFGASGRGFTMGYGAADGTYFTHFAAYADFW
jgi:hypothetical protein